MMQSEFIIALIGLLTTIGGSWASFFFTRKKYHSEVDSTVIENMKQSLEFYTKLSDDNKARLDEALKRNEQLEQEIRELRQQVYSLMENLCYDLSCAYRAKVAKPARRNNTRSKEHENN